MNRSRKRNISKIGTVDITAPAIKCCRGTSEEFKEATPLVRVNVRGSSNNINASKNSFQAIIKT
jgi:hypothetical protein